MSQLETPWKICDMHQMAMEIIMFTYKKCSGSQGLNGYLRKTEEKVSIQ